MRELFKNKTKAALEQAHVDGWNEGFELGRKKALAEAQKVFTKRIQKEITEVSPKLDILYIEGLKRAVALIRSK
jgi:hypothetical protein